MSKHELADLSGVSISFISDITTGDGNPSLRTMEAISNALNTPLPMLLEFNDLDKDALEALAGRSVSLTVGLPQGYERVCLVLPEHRAFQVKKWGEEARIKLQNESWHK